MTPSHILTGVLFGKHPLAPKISPKKTIEGLLGSLIFTVIGGSLAFHYIMNSDWWLGALAGILTVKGGTGAIVEYFGDGCASFSATGKGTICNMGAEIGATTSIFPCDESMMRYLRSTDRSDIAEMASGVMEHLRADDEVIANPEAYYDQVIHIDLDALEPHVNGPFTPDRAMPISEFTKAVKENNWPAELRVALIGSCTNSSYEDMSRVAEISSYDGISRTQNKK